MGVLWRGRPRLSIGDLLSYRIGPRYLRWPFEYVSEVRYGVESKRYFVIVDQTVSDPHDWNKEPIDLALDSVCHRLVEDDGMIGCNGGSSIFFKRWGRRLFSVVRLSMPV